MEDTQTEKRKQPRITRMGADGEAKKTPNAERPTPNAERQTGKLLAPRTLLLRHAVGEAASGEGLKYEMAANFADMSPIVRSKQTGVWFHLPWPEIIDLAVAAGVDDKKSSPSVSSAKSAVKKSGGRS